MIVQSIQVKNFRSIYDETIQLDSLTALLGRNGSGKSSLLSALEHFYDPSAKVVDGDYYNEDTDQDIEIILTFSDLTSEEHEFFSKYLTGETLTVARVFSMRSGKIEGVYHGELLQHRGFSKVRSAGKAMLIRKEYKNLQQESQYSSLPNVPSAPKAITELEEWERAHPDQCEMMRDEGNFFGFKNVAQGYLGRFTKFIKIPAVRDAGTDAVEGRGSCITEIMDLVVRKALNSHEEVIRLKAEAQAELDRILAPNRQPELSDLQTDLTTTLRHYVSDTSVFLDWSDPLEISVPTPRAQVKLSEDGYATTVERTGHGLQRAFILTMLQHLTAVREGSSANDPQDGNRIPNLVLAIEEPELYQHPSRQRHLSSVLRNLAEGSISGVANRTQVVYTTHAPLFVDLDRFDQIRILRKVERSPRLPKVSTVSKATLGEIARKLWDLSARPGDPFTPESIRTRLQTIMTPWMNEGFFADIVVLVEGEADRAAVLAMAESVGYELSSRGIAVVPCGGKTAIDRPALVFRELGIHTYLIWDNDQGIKATERDPARTNRLLLRIVGAEEEDWPVGVNDTYACLQGNLETILKSEIPSDLYSTLLTEASVEYGIERSKVEKNPVTLRALIAEATRRGHDIRTVRTIVERIAALREAS